MSSLARRLSSKQVESSARHCLFGPSVIDVALHVPEQGCHDCSHRTLCTRCVLNANSTNGCFDDSFSSAEPACVMNVETHTIFVMCSDNYTQLYNRSPAGPHLGEISKTIQSAATPCIVEEEQNMWRRAMKGTTFQLDAWRKSGTVLSLRC